MLNCLSFDIEGFVESNFQSLVIDKAWMDRGKELYEIEKNVDAILDLLNELNTKATFFFLGTVARGLPHLIRSVANDGHEIGSHGDEHIRVFDMRKNEFRDKIRAAKWFLEDLSSKPVYGFRAPDFSITKESAWALDILKETGFSYDSSIYPFGFHDVYGIKDESPFIHRVENGLVEFPLSTVKLLGRRIPFGGGGYFRLYPLFLTTLFLRKVNMLGEPCMFYLHPYEVGPAIPIVSNISFYRRFRHYYNWRKGGHRLRVILSEYRFGRAIDVLLKKVLPKR